MSHHQNAGQNHNMMVIIKSFDNMTAFKYLGATVTNKNEIVDKIRK
jgi:hypothetical protein